MYKTRTVYMERDRVYSHSEKGLEIDTDYLYQSMRKFDWEITIFSYHDGIIDVYGNYPRNKIIKIKKFFYDTYPLVIKVEPTKYGIRAFFGLNVSPFPKRTRIADQHDVASHLHRSGCKNHYVVFEDLDNKYGFKLKICQVEN